MIIPSIGTLLDTVPLMKDASKSGNLTVLKSLLGPAYRGLIQQRGKAEASTVMPVRHDVHFDWTYLRDHTQLSRLYEAAKVGQWNATTDLDWNIGVDPENETRALIPTEFVPVSKLQVWKRMNPREQSQLKRALISWFLSQFLHGEQGALYAACQVTEAIPWLDGKLYGSTQVVDEGRHVEVFHAYLTRKLEKKYDINDNLYVVVDALMTDSRWDMKFLGMQIMIEGLALGAFGIIQQTTLEPLLKKLLTYVIADEARHVHYGVLALEEFMKQLSDRERREREDWTFEVCLFLRNRFFAHEFYDEYFSHQMSRAAWDQLVMGSEMRTSWS